MRKNPRIIILTIIFIFLYFLLKGDKINYEDQRFQKARAVVQKLGNRFRARVENPNQVVIAIVACNLKQFELVVTMVKSALLLSTDDDQHHLLFIIVTEKELFTSFDDRLKEMRKYRKFSFTLREVNFPKINSENWKKMGISDVCSAQKIFFPSLLSDFNALLYLNPESIFLSPPHETFKLLRHFKKIQMAALAVEEIGSVYNEKKGHRYYGLNGINSGVMLMDLQKMREVNWEKELQQLYVANRNVPYGDQDLINIYFSTRPDALYELPCDYNFRTEHCVESTACTAPEGIKIFQANRDVFFGNKDIIFRNLHGVIEKVKLV
jgi:UDP-xylose:glucoside alpha-1,3-xylosyltransferase